MGILFGRASGSDVTVSSFRPLPEAPEAPANFQARMQRVMHAAASDSSLRRQIPVGGYCARFGSDLALTPEEAAFWNQQFPFRWQILLTIAVRQGSPGRAGFLFRPTDLADPAPVPLLEFEVAEPGPAASASALPPPPGELFKIPRERGAGRVKWYALGALAALFALGAGYQYGREGTGVNAQAPEAGLRISEQDGMLTVAWTPGAPFLQSLQETTLTIVDGDRKTVMPLNDPVLLPGFRSIARQTGKVIARIAGLDQTGMPVVVETARFIAPPPAPPPEPADDQVARIRSEIRRAKGRLEREIRTNQMLEDTLSRIRRRPERSEAEPPAAGPARETPDPPSYSGPVSGRIIWTGYLPANSTLIIDGARSSAGSLSASLPPVRTRIRVLPAEISGSGLTVFTIDAARANTREARSALNGWMNTQFVHDRARAQDARLAEAPTEANPQRARVRSGPRAVSALVIDWEISK
jgi:hypothetical protein